MTALDELETGFNDKAVEVLVRFQRKVFNHMAVAAAAVVVVGVVAVATLTIYGLTGAAVGAILVEVLVLCGVFLVIVIGLRRELSRTEDEVDELVARAVSCLPEEVAEQWRELVTSDLPEDVVSDGNQLVFDYLDDPAGNEDVIARLIALRTSTEDS